jgi:hypothetical protein
MTRAWIALLALTGGAALAQQSPSYKLEEYAFNAGGHPVAGVSPASAGQRITLGSIGESFPLRRHFGPTFVLDGGFLFPYFPPGEVLDLRFTNATTLEWDPQVSAGRYNLYRDALAALGGLGYGGCTQQNLTTATTTDATLAPPGAGFFYLVTVENRLGDEGTKGFRSSGEERGGAVCP